MFRILSVVK